MSKLTEMILGGLMEAAKDGGDWDVSAEGDDWRIQPSFSAPEPIVEAIACGEDGDTIIKQRRFRISIEEIL